MTKGDGGADLLPWALIRHTSHGIHVQQLLARAQHLDMHMGQSSYSTGREQTPEDSRDLHPGENGAPAGNELVFLMGDGQKACVYPA